MTRTTILLAVLLTGTLTASAPPAPVPTSTQAAVMTADRCGAHAELSRLDTRTAVPLLPMMADHQKKDMRDHLLAVEEVVRSLGADDFAAIEKAVARIGYTEGTGQMCTHMGLGAPGFSDQALRFHHAADGIGIAARKRDRGGVLAALGATLSTCTSCHAAYRQEVVDEAAWRAIAAAPAPAAGAGSGEPARTPPQQRR